MEGMGNMEGMRNRESVGSFNFILRILSQYNIKRFNFKSWKSSTILIINMKVPRDKDFLHGLTKNNFILCFLIIN